MDEAPIELCDDESKLYDGWVRFITEVMQGTMRNCKWLCGVDCAKVLSGGVPASNSGRNHLAQACASWAWVFHGTGGDFAFNDVCDSVGLNPERCRKMFAYECRHGGDINTVVAKFIEGKLPGVSDIGCMEE